MQYTFEELVKKVEKWAEDRQIIPNATSESQLLKFFSEAGELADAQGKCSDDEKIDAVGDILVCLINYCALEGFEITACLESAYNEIKDRKGTLLPNGVFVKES